MILKGRFKPQEIESTGDDRPVRNIFGYTFRMSGRHQICVCLLALVISPLNLAPVELQRRIVNEVTGEANADLLFLMGGVFLAVVIMHQLLKFGLRMYQVWIAESAIIYTRRHLLSVKERSEVDGEEDNAGRDVPVIVREADSLGAFVGTGLSQALANMALLIGIVGYMFAIEPRIALASLVFFIPQIAITPIVQRRLNRFTEKRLGFLRALGELVSSQNDAETEREPSVLSSIFRNRMSFSATKFSLKAVRNLLTALPTISALVFGGYLVIEGQIQLGTVVAFVAGFDKISGPMRELLLFYSQAAQADVQHKMIADWIKDRKKSETDKK